MGKQKRKDRTDEVLDLVGLAEERDNHVSTYSGGMKRRLFVSIRTQDSYYSSIVGSLEVSLIEC